MSRWIATGFRRAPTASSPYCASSRPGTNCIRRSSQIVEAGTGREFSPDANEWWAEETRPIVEAFFHARFMVEMVCKYGHELEEAPELLPSGWAAVLELDRLR